MKPNRCLGANGVAAIALVVALASLTAAALTSCEYFDPFNPLSRGPGGSGSSITWTRVIRPSPSLAGAGNGDDVGMCIQQTEDHGFIIAGYMQRQVGGNFDVWLVKTDSLGNMEWDAIYGEGGNDIGYYVEQTSDGGYILVGSKEIDRGGGLWDADLWLIKIKPDDQEQGAVDWQRLYGESGTEEIGCCVRCTEDGGYIITGQKENTTTDYFNLWLVKTHEDGSHDWNRTFGGSSSAYGACVSQTIHDSGYVTGYVVAGVLWSDSSENAYLVKTDPAGDLDGAWNPNPKDFGAFDEPDYAYYVQQTYDGGYILAGETRSFGAAGMDALVIKLDASGNLDNQWETNPKTLHSADLGGHDRANCVQQTYDGGYILAGMTHYNDQDAWLIKTDAYGNMLWDEFFGDVGYEEAESVRETVDGGYILAGRTNSDPGGFNLYLVYYKP